MKIAVLQENLYKGLSIVSRSVSSKATLPILGNILLITEKGRLKLQGTNLETGISLWLGAKIEEEGGITIPAKVITELVSSLPPEVIQLESSEQALHLFSGSFKAYLNGIAVTEFPKIPSFPEKPDLVFGKEEFIAALSQVGFAAASDEGRPILTGVLIKNEKEKVSFVSTDGYRLSIKNLPVGEQKMEGNLLVPAKTLLEVSRIAQEKNEEEKEIRVAQSSEKGQIVFSLSNVEFSSRLLEGEFPEFTKIIPVSFATRAEFSKEDFLRATKIASIFAREQANIVKLKIENGKLKISAETPQVGSNESEIEAKTEGESLEIAFNFRFLLDFLNSLTKEEIVFEASGPLAPGVFKIKDDNSFLHVIMPVRIQV